MKLFYAVTSLLFFVSCGKSINGTDLHNDKSDF